MKKGLVILVSLVWCLMALADNASRAKARYYFIQGSVEAAAQRMPEAYEYFKKAYETDPQYRDAAFNYGGNRLLLRTDTLQSDSELERSLGMMQSYIDDNPRDLYGVQMYGYLTTALDTVEEAIRVYERTYSLMPKETRLLQALSDAYLRHMNSKAALDALERYEAIEGKSQDLSLKKITILLAAKDTVGAVGEVEHLITLNPRDPYNYLLKGNLYEVVGNQDSVLSAYKRAEELSPDNGAVKMSLAQYYRNVGDSVMLDNMMYEALLSEDFELEDKMGILGDYLQRLLDESGNRSRGDHLFSVLQEQYPHEPAVLEMSARYSGAKGEFSDARETISYALDQDPTNEKYWMMLLSYDLTDSKYEQAISDYRRGLDHVVPTLRMKNLYAAAASMIKDSIEGEKILTDLLIETDARLTTPEGRETVRKNLDYDNLTWVSSLFCMLGDLHYKRGEADKAFEEYENSLFFIKDNALTLNNYAYFLSEANRDLEKALQMSRRSLDLSENNPTYLDTYAWILYKMGNYREALEYMELALELAGEEGRENEEYQKHYEAIKEAVRNSSEDLEKETIK